MESISLWLGTDCVCRPNQADGISLDCKTVGFFLKISKEIGKTWRKSLTRAKRASLTRPTGVWGEAKWAVFKIPGFVCKPFLPFFPTPSPLFYLRHFSRGLWLSFLVLCSETARKRLLRRLGEREKTDCPFSIQWVRSDQGVQKCRQAVKRLFTASPSLRIWFTRWLILRENTRVIVHALGFESWRCNSVILMHFLA